MNPQVFRGTRSYGDTARMVTDRRPNKPGKSRRRSEAETSICIFANKHPIRQKVPRVLADE